MARQILASCGPDFLQVQASGYVSVLCHGRSTSAGASDPVPGKLLTHSTFCSHVNVMSGAPTNDYLLYPLICQLFSS